MKEFAEHAADILSRLLGADTSGSVFYFLNSGVGMAANAQFPELTTANTPNGPVSVISVLGIINSILARSGEYRVTPVVDKNNRVISFTWYCPTEEKPSEVQVSEEERQARTDEYFPA